MNVEIVRDFPNPHLQRTGSDETGWQDSNQYSLNTIPRSSNRQKKFMDQGKRTRRIPWFEKLRKQNSRLRSCVLCIRGAACYVYGAWRRGRGGRIPSGHLPNPHPYCTRCKRRDQHTGPRSVLTECPLMPFSQAHLLHCPSRGVGGGETPPLDWMAASSGDTACPVQKLRNNTRCCSDRGVALAVGHNHCKWQ